MYEDHHELSREQIKCWEYHSTLEEDLLHELLETTALLKGIHITYLCKAWELVIKRHDSLRTCCHDHGDIVMSCILRYDESLFAPVVTDVSMIGEEDQRAATIQKIIQHCRVAMNSIYVPPLVRMNIFQLPDDASYVHLMLHHMIADEWSLDILRSELVTFYQALAEGRPAGISPPEMQMKQYALWQKDRLAENSEATGTYWQRTFQDIMDGRQADVKTNEELHKLLNTGKIARYEGYISPQDYTDLVRLCSTGGFRLLSLLISGIQLLFYCMGNKKPLLYLPVSSRFLSGAWSAIGYQMGGVYHYFDLPLQATFIEFVRQTQDNFLASAQNFIFDQRLVGLGDLDLRSQCDLFLNFIAKELNGNKPPELSAPTSHELLGGPQYYGLAYDVLEYRDGLRVFWKYNTELYTPSVIESMVRLQSRLLRTICDNPASTISEVINQLKDEESS